jgi:hypothetical protein
MNPLALGLPLALPSLSIASRAASNGLGFLKSLVAPALPSPAPRTGSPSAGLTDLQRSVAEEVRRSGFSAALPLGVAGFGQGPLSLLSDSPDRAAIEQRLNANPYIVQQFRALAERAHGMLRLTIPAGTGLDASA